MYFYGVCSGYLVPLMVFFLVLVYLLMEFFSDSYVCLKFFNMVFSCSYMRLKSCELLFDVIKILLNILALVLLDKCLYANVV